MKPVYLCLDVRKSRKGKEKEMKVGILYHFVLGLREVKLELAKILCFTRWVEINLYSYPENLGSRSCNHILLFSEFLFSQIYY